MASDQPQQPIEIASLYGRIHNDLITLLANETSGYFRRLIGRLNEYTQVLNTNLRSGNTQGQVVSYINIALTLGNMVTAGLSIASQAFDDGHEIRPYLLVLDNILRFSVNLMAKMAKLEEPSVKKAQIEASQAINNLLDKAEQREATAKRTSSHKKTASPIPRRATTLTTIGTPQRATSSSAAVVKHATSSAIEEQLPITPSERAAAKRIITERMVSPSPPPPPLPMPTPPPSLLSPSSSTSSPTIVIESSMARKKSIIQQPLLEAISNPTIDDIPEFLHNIRKPLWLLLDATFNSDPKRISMALRNLQRPINQLKTVRNPVEKDQLIRDIVIQLLGFVRTRAFNLKQWIDRLSKSKQDYKSRLHLLKLFYTQSNDVQTVLNYTIGLMRLTREPHQLQKEQTELLHLIKNNASSIQIIRAEIEQWRDSIRFTPTAHDYFALSSRREAKHYNLNGEPLFINHIGYSERVKFPPNKNDEHRTRSAPHNMERRRIMTTSRVVSFPPLPQKKRHGSNGVTASLRRRTATFTQQQQQQSPEQINPVQPLWWHAPMQPYYQHDAATVLAGQGRRSVNLKVKRLASKK
jgi:hypothetical protein